MQNTPQALTNLFIKTIYQYCHPCLSTGSKEILKKEREKSQLIIFSPKWFEGGGGYIDALPKESHQLKIYVKALKRQRGL